ncbi:MAG: IS3 family transposase [Candidatus Rokuibacteriota bacterium]
MPDDLHDRFLDPPPRLALRVDGRPRLDPELRDLIQRMARENPTWGRRRIQAELALLGYSVAELTVAKYMQRTSPRPSPTWRAFLATHAREIIAVDFFLVPTLTFRLLFVFVGLRHDRRELIHVNVTDHPTAGWAARQLIEAFPEETAPKYLLRDRDAIYGEVFTRCVAQMGIRQVAAAPRAPWQNPFVERVIGHPPRVPGSLHDSKRDPSSPAPASLRRLLQRGAAPSSA